MGQVSIGCSWEGGRAGRHVYTFVLTTCPEWFLLPPAQPGEPDGQVTLAGEGVVLAMAHQGAAQPRGLGSCGPFLAVDMGVE